METFQREEYNKCLKKFNLKLKCSSCNYIFIKAEIHIDTNGKMVKYIKLSENICGKKATKEFEECFMKYFKNVKYPEILRSMKIKAMIGTGLRC